MKKQPNSSKNIELTTIVQGCKNGNAESFSQLIEIYSGRLYGYFYRLSGNRDISDELLSELFVKLVEKIGTFRGERFESWLFKVAANIFYDFLRKKELQKRYLDSQRDNFTEQLEPESSSNEITDDLQKKLEKLDEETRQLLMMRFYSDLSFKEIAAMRSEPIGTTLSKVHRGLKKLREMMDTEIS